jgi:hypothetical protein
MVFLQSRRVTSKEEEKEISFFSKALKRERALLLLEGGGVRVRQSLHPGGAACAAYSPSPICSCIEVLALEMRNYDLATLQADDDVMGTLNRYGSRGDLEGVLGKPAFEEGTNKIQIGYQ